MNKDMGERVRARRENLGLTQAQLAEAVGCSQPMIKKIEAGSKTSLGRKLAIALKTTLEWLETGISDRENRADVNAESGNKQFTEIAEGELPPDDYNLSRLPEQRTPVGASAARRVYVVGRANGGLPERIWTDGGYLVGATEEFAVLATEDEHAFLTPIIGTSMSPVYNPGDFAFVEPGTEVELGDDVLVRLKTGETMLKVLRSIRNGVQLGSYNDPGTLFYKLEEITWMYYVAHPVRRKKIKTRY